MEADLERVKREGRLATARALQIDAVTGDVVAALRRAGVDPLLLKGPALANWLYADGTARPYVDCDLMIAPEDEPAAARVLGSLGFERSTAADHLEPRFGPLHADTWQRRRDGAEVDLHRALSGMRMGGSDVLGELARDAEVMRVGREDVRVPAPYGRALIVALHAAHHGEVASQPVTDLGRAIRQLSPAGWRQTAALAERLHVIPPLAIGLDLLPEGRELARELGLPDAEIAAAAHAGGGLALGFSRLAARRGLTAKLSLLARELVPSPRFMRWSSRLARRGPVGLALSYPWRWAYLLARAGPGLRDYRRSRASRRSTAIS